MISTVQMGIIFVCVKEYKFILSQLWRKDVQSQDAGKHSTLNSRMSLPASGGSWKLLVFLGL
jgi:hypothetical protein